MKKLISIFLGISVVIVSLTSCDMYNSNSVYRSKKSELYAVACFSVPFITGESWDSLEIIEKDNYGRIIFIYSSSTGIMSDYCSNDLLYSLVICQKYDKDYSYYYENYDFIYLTSKDEFTDYELDILKEKNDWNKPLNESKMSKVVNSFTPYRNSYVSSEKALYDISKHISIEEKNDIEYKCDEICVDDYKRCLYAVRTYVYNRKYTFYNSYFVVCDENNNVLTENGKPCILKIEDVVHCQNDMKTIKERSNWNKPR